MTPFLVYVGVGLLLVGAVVSTEFGFFRLVGFIAAPMFILLGLLFLALLLVLSLAAAPFNTSARDLILFLRTAIWLGPIDVCVAPAPVGAVSDIRQMSVDAKSGLQHASPYNDPQALQWIVEWIEPFRDREGIFDKPPRSDA